MPERDEVSWNSIISGYVGSGEIEKARDLFEEMPVRRNIVCWTSLINGYGKEGNLNEMLGLFLQMLVSVDDVGPNSATMVCLLSACSSLSDFKLGKLVSIFIDVNEIPLNTILSTALIDMYLKCGDLEKAWRLFDGISCKSLVSWNALITGYVQRGLLEEAVRLFYLMQAESVKPNEITMVNVLSACAGLGALELGREVHIYLGRKGLDLNVILATALVDMYSKCGRLIDACLVFVKTTNKDVALFNTMILGLAYHGHGRDSLAVFAEMEKNGPDANDVTFIGVLSACNHSGLIEEGRVQFSNMVKKQKLIPKVEHYSCMVDLLGRAGYLDEAFEMIQNMEVPPDSIIWGSLLSSCRIHRNIELADKIGEAILSSQDPNLGFCILLSNIYASVGRWKDVARVRRLVKEKGIKKPSGCSWIEVDGVIHRFLVEDSIHLQSKEIYEIHEFVTNQLKVEGYVPNFDFVLKNIDGM
ncbi:Pentatricopeptide repeat [Macleaya cordata]|uniref:Pentatricopeptide repeat n=1 Tax=Macleaya cordata TaxID=56857 RepID=A0A200Q514_MACCD|nr:Pentatricopeptide repeat [Macleaya cordata]